jgi:hypothetical protein
MTKYEVGNVVSVEFPFSDLQGQKRRPGLVLLIDDVDVIVTRLTTQPPRQVSDVALTRWSETGLIGHLHPDNAPNVARECEKLSATLVAELRK